MKGVVVAPNKMGLKKSELKRFEKKSVGKMRFRKIKSRRRPDATDSEVDWSPNLRVEFPTFHNL